LLDDNDRGFLENLIDKQIQGVEDIVSIARNENNKKEWQIQNDGDFTLGWALGVIFNDFALYYSQFHKAYMDQEQVNQAINIISKRIREIKEAIFKCG